MKTTAISLLLGLGLIQSGQAAEPPLKYVASIEIKQYDAQDFPKSKTILKLENIPVELKQQGEKPGLWATVHRIDEKFYFEARLIDFSHVNGESRVRLDFALGYLHDITSSGKPGTVGGALCEIRANYADFSSLAILEKVAAESWCKDRTLFATGISIKKVPPQSLSQ